MKRLVVDASVALKWVLIEPDTPAARAVLDQSLVAPDWWIVEAGNGLWKAVGRGEVSIADAVEALDGLRAVPVERVPADSVLTQALELAARLRHPIYDCLYLALAMQLGVPMVSADDRFRRALSSHPDLNAWLIMLHDFHTPS